MSLLLDKITIGAKDPGCMKCTMPTRVHTCSKVFTCLPFESSRVLYFVEGKLGVTDVVNTYN